MRVLQLLACSVLATVAAAAASPKPNVFQRAELVKERVLGTRQARQTTPNAPKPRLQKRSSRYLTNITQPFAVNGTGIPDVNFDVGESYAGLLPISNATNEQRKLFFWFFPTTNPDAGKEVVIWLNGGPGCSSLSGLLTENGPFTWDAGTLSPVQNPYSWTNLSNILWVEQPVGVGYTQGTPDIYNETALAQEFLGFYRNFLKTFQLQGAKTYVTGESYAGFYVPYIADAFISSGDVQLSGIAINDPIIGDETVQQQVVIVPYMDYWANLFYLNATFNRQIHQRADQCGYTDYYNKYLAFPPPAGPFPVLPDPYYSDTYECDVFDTSYEALLEINPCFNIYHVTETCPHPFSVLGIVNPGDYNPPGYSVYFNRTDVQKAINAPVGTNWAQCTPTNVFGGPTDNQSLSDTSLGPAQNGVLQRVIEYTNNTIIGSGNLDMLLSTNGTLIAIQNMTWNGMQGLQSYPATPWYTPYHPEYNGGALAGAGYLGTYGSERGLTFYTAQLAGHELPGYASGAAYRVLELLLGRIKSLEEVGPFTTQMGGNYTGTGTIY